VYMPCDDGSVDYSDEVLNICGYINCIGHGFDSEHRFSHHGVSAFSKLRSLAKCSLDDSVRRLL